MAKTKLAGSMSAAEFRVAMETLGWKGPAVAEKLGVSVGQVSAWRTGRVPVPGPVAAYMRLSMKVLVP